ncbi:DNA alkylation repair protein [Candidatus Roizmanbacteria bacterium RIFCSPLOWO2_01_FULL_37_13]|uniref:DNA alkylation repair protein n=1 Tax=Candidatus Roizmanbacteria bacterium RIFCSPHIGHO2_02_FULL_38_11 TaxID=1802039 RepID=A0A1F7GX24_9BACT|nr:MAG: DNA alkylation repair protein [Candidatus Roizmanbacteria bacterium RIFCSPHIGHO2_02_FULL_38_11]OGK42663.1 MAG: DNA alkylation repair protein [Candidatus Roizmanbacteria bacterium RIFCSPLOWO2_01_FULL_37_13]
MLEQLQKDLRKLANPQKAKILQRFFKTGKGEYGEGDVFLGITVPEQRKIAIRFKTLDLRDIQKLLNSKIHEERLIALLILFEKYRKANDLDKKKVFDFYLKNSKRINNWDLVDLSAHLILGDYLLYRDKSVVYRLAESKNLWERRIAVLTTFRFIKYNQFEDSLKIGQMLLKDKHDLIQKAVGWMLREIGKRDQEVEEEFLKKYYKIMPRTMLRYAIERFDGKKKKFYLKK